jgi:serine protease Do
LRYAYTTAALLLAGTGLALASNIPAGAQTAQNEGMRASAPRGAPQSFADMVSKLQPAVVSIQTRSRVAVKGGNNPFAGTPLDGLLEIPDNDDDGTPPKTRPGRQAGSGFIISADGYVVTNDHVVTAKNGKVESIIVVLTDRTEYTAKLIGVDPTSDLALLKISAPKPLPFVKFGDSTKARVGDWVVAIGNPFDLGSTVSAGIISALHRNTGLGVGTDRFIQTDASINQGNSGGPLFDMNGDVIGIPSQIMSPSGGNIGIGFAIPSEQAVPVINTLRAGGTMKRGYLGISITQLDDDRADALGLDKNRGEFVEAVVPGAAADAAGIKPGDVIVRVGGRTVTRDDTLSYLVAGQPVGTRVPVDIIRDGKPMTLTATMAERPSEEKIAAVQKGSRPDQQSFGNQSRPGDQKGASSQPLGFAAIPLTPDIARDVGVPATTQGLVVTAVDNSTDAGQKGLQRGDVILTAGMNNAPVATSADLDKAAADAKKAGRAAVMLQIRRGAKDPQFLPVRLRDS